MGERFTRWNEGVIMETAETLLDNIEINGKRVHVTVTIRYTCDQYYEVDEEFETLEQEREYRDKLERGFYQPVCIQVIARALGEEGMDSLGGVVIEEGKAQLMEAVECNGMVNNAKVDLVKAICRKMEILKPFSEG